MKTNGSGNSAAQFVSDFTSLIAAVDKLMVDIAGTNGKRYEDKPNGGTRPDTLNSTISTLRAHAHWLVKAPIQSMPSEPHTEIPSVLDLIVNLGDAPTLKSMADTLGDYCGSALRSPAGMVFIEQEGDLKLVSEWRSKQVSKKHLTEHLIKKGPVDRVFRTGEPIFWRKDRTPYSTLASWTYRLLRPWHGRSVIFLPIKAPKQKPIGVVVIVVGNRNGFAQPDFVALTRLGQIVSACVVRGRAYEEALEARARAEKAIQSKDEFLSMLSHELKNPMMPILGWAVALSSGSLPAEKQNLALEGIVRNVRALNYLIEDLFDTMRIAAGKFRIELAETRIQEVAREALNSVQHNVESKKLRISTDISEAIPPFMADPRRLQQVFVNLLNNAVKFTPDGGSISIRVRKRNQTVECAIRDTGKGIERKFLPFVFERFRQQSSPSKAQMGGLGLGLAIVRQIVELHGGSIRVFSGGTDRGTTVIVRLPTRRKRSIDSKERPRAASEKTSQNIRSNSDTRRSF